MYTSLIAFDLKLSGLNKKGVEIIKPAKENFKEIKNITNKEFESNVAIKFVPKFVKDILANVNVRQVVSGQHAFLCFCK